MQRPLLMCAAQPNLSRSWTQEAGARAPIRIFRPESGFDPKEREGKGSIFHRRSLIPFPRLASLASPGMTREGAREGISDLAEPRFPGGRSAPIGSMDASAFLAACKKLPELIA